VSSKDGTLQGPKRKSAAEPQVVDVIMTNPDLLYADVWDHPRYGPKALTLMISALFKEHYGFDMQYKQYGKPTLPTF